LALNEGQVSQEALKKLNTIRKTLSGQKVGYFPGNGGFSLHGAMSAASGASLLRGWVRDNLWNCSITR